MLDKIRFDYSIDPKISSARKDELSVFFKKFKKAQSLNPLEKPTSKNLTLHFVSSEFVKGENLKGFFVKVEDSLTFSFPHNEKITYDLVLDDTSDEFLLNTIIEKFYYDYQVKRKIELSTLEKKSLQDLKEAGTRETKPKLEILGLIDQIFLGNDISSWNKELKRRLGAGISVVSLDEVNEEILLCSVGKMAEIELYLNCGKSFFLENSLEVCWVYTYLGLKLLVEDKEKESSVLRDILRQHPRPLAFFDKDKKIVEANEAFLNFKISNKVIFSDNERFEGYSVQKIRLSNDHYLVQITINHPASLNFNSQMEMGIITSSIAHELNNPIAGIKAALQVMMLIHKEEGNDSFYKMSESVERCADLIRTFLDFSKSSHEFTKTNIKLAFKEALSLLRNRSLDLKVHIKEDYSLKNTYGYPLNRSFLVMIFYILGNDILTHFAREKMIIGQDVRNEDLVIKLIEDNDYFSLSLKQDNLTEGEETKLLNYLIVENSLELKRTENLISLHKV